MVVASGDVTRWKAEKCSMRFVSETAGRGTAFISTRFPDSGSRARIRGLSKERAHPRLARESRIIQNEALP